MSTVGFRTPVSSIWRAELIRMKGSVLMWLPLIGVPLAGLSALLAVAAGTNDATGLVWWQGMYLTGMAAPLLGVFAAVTESRETRARFGGVDTRPVVPEQVRAGRLLGVVVAVAAFHLLNFGGTWLVTLLAGGGVTDQIFRVGGLAFMGSIGTAALGMVLARIFGLTWTVILLSGWQLAGTLMAESRWWWAFPPAWPVRLLLPELGLHANLVPLEPDSPLASEQPGLAVLLILGFAALTSMSAVIVSGRRISVLRWRRRDIVTGVEELPSVAQRGTECHGHVSGWQVLRALHRVLRRSSVTVLMAVTTVLLAVTAWLYPPEYVHGLAAFLLLPLGTAVAPMITWRLLSPAWRVMVTENPGARVGLVVWHLLIVAVLCVLVACAGLMAGAAVGPELLRCLIAMIVGGALVAGSLAVVIRFSLGAGALVGVVWTVVSATLGGDVLAGSRLWLVALPAWPHTAGSPVRMVIAVVVGSGLLAIAVAAVFSALRRFDRRT